jgi:hypothetical protein
MTIRIAFDPASIAPSVVRPGGIASKLARWLAADAPIAG